MKFRDFSQKEKGEVFEILKSRETGLTEKEVEERQRVYGLNEVKTKEIGTFNILIRQLKSAFFYLLFLAGILAFLFGEKI